MKSGQRILSKFQTGKRAIAVVLVATLAIETPGLSMAETGGAHTPATRAGVFGCSPSRTVSEFDRQALIARYVLGYTGPKRSSEVRRELGHWLPKKPSRRKVSSLGIWTLAATMAASGLLMMGEEARRPATPS